MRHLFAAYDLAEDQLCGHIKKTKKWSKFLEFCRYLRSLHPAHVRVAIVCDNYSPHLTTKRCQRVGTWAAANNVEVAYTPTNSSWLNRIEAQFTALRYFALDGTDHASHKAQGSMIRRYLIWRNRHAADERLREVVTRARRLTQRQLHMCAATCQLLRTLVVESGDDADVRWTCPGSRRSGGPAASSDCVRGGACGWWTTTVRRP